MDHKFFSTYRVPGQPDMDRTVTLAGSGDIEINEVYETSGDPLVLAIPAAGIVGLVLQSSVAATVQFLDASDANVGAAYAVEANVPLVVGLTAGEVAAAIPAATQVSALPAEAPAAGETLKVRGKYDATP